MTATTILAIVAAAPLGAQSSMTIGHQPPAATNVQPPAAYPYPLPLRPRKVRCEQDHIGPCPTGTARRVVVQETSDYSVVIVPKKVPRCEQDHIAPCDR